MHALKKIPRTETGSLRLLTGWLLLVLLATAGCTSTNRARFQVAGSAVTDHQRMVTPNDRQAVKEVVQSVANQFHLRDATQSSIVQDAIGYYYEPDTENPIKLLAWPTSNAIVIDLTHVPASGVGETPEYRQARELLIQKLQNRFGSQVSIVPYGDIVTARPGAAR